MGSRVRGKKFGDRGGWAFKPTQPIGETKVIRLNPAGPQLVSRTRASRNEEHGVRWSSRWVGRQDMPPEEPWHRTTPPWEHKPTTA